MTADLSLWVIYDRPSDFPRGPRFVARRQSVGVNGQITFDPTAVSSWSLETLRDHVRHAGAETCLGREPGDQPQHRRGVDMKPEPEDCPDCEGAGEISRGRDLMICDTCDGEGRWCPECAEPAGRCACEEP